MVHTLAITAALALPLIADAAPLRKTRRTTPVKRLTWTVQSVSTGANFLDDWSFFTAGDPTHGQVTYVDSSSLAYYASDSNSTILKVDDSTDLAAGQPRQSVRISSNTVVNENSLVILDAAHVPYGCATWPAFWMVGPNWPSGGEIDIFEGVNLNTDNQMTLHTSAGCTHDSSQPETGTELQQDCDANVNSNAGCGVKDNSGASYGDAFNNNGGGVWATQWDSDGISIWFFPRASVPADISSGSPNPSGWGTPSGFWAFTTCQSSFFNNMQAVFDITLCGDWAGQQAVYSMTCGSGTCSDQVMSGANFHDAFFQVNSVQFFTGA